MQTFIPQNTNWLAFFRISVACFALAHFLSIQSDFDLLYSYQAYIYPDILNASHDHIGPTLTTLHQWFESTGISVSYSGLLWFCRVVYPCFMVGLALGLFTRVSAVGALFFQILFIQSIHLYQYGVDAYTTIALFYCCLFPVGKILALDGWLRPQRDAPDSQKFYLTILQLHLGVAYFFSGLDKVVGQTWRNGEAVWKALHSHCYGGNLVNLDGLAHTPFFWLMGWGTVLLEMGYLPLVLLPRTRLVALSFMISLHLGIGLFLGLYFFSALMILLNLSAFYAPYTKAALTPVNP